MSKLVSGLLAAALMAQAALPALAQSATSTPPPVSAETNSNADAQAVMPIITATLPRIDATITTGQPRGGTPIISGSPIASDTPTASNVPEVSLTPTALSTSNTAAIPPTGESLPFKTLAQADLSVLTGNVQRPNGIFWFQDKLYTSCTGDGTVYVIDDKTGDTKAYIYGIHNAQSLYVENDANNNLAMWIPDYATNTFNKVTRAGVVPVVKDLKGPWGISYVDDQQFLITNLLSNTINLISRAGANQVVLTGLDAPMGIVHDDQTLYVANYGTTHRSIEWYSYSDVVQGSDSTPDPTQHLLVSGLQNTTDLQLGSDGKLYFAYSTGNRGLVGRVDPKVCAAQGGCTADQIDVVLYSDLNAPLAGLTITPDMRLFVHTMFTPEIYWAQIIG